ncbi:MAG: 23S rRNA pseudouridine(1911/1915/1917) synthase RluD [Gammaproteobacteria bacterium]|nr:23S rRNA pseudouridine(1911/1915/1917) synthase RluD [Gammaproteobacteria bacterium]MBK80289.1 23S rRNA pseudouridine(1911/1915/1917) synthase RluD [Gammaproteobacteria bacterium]
MGRQASVPPELAGERLDRAAAVLFPEFSRAMLSRWIQGGELTVDGAPGRPKHRLAGGEVLRLDATLVPREDWTSAEAVAFDVVYQDDALLVVDKPPGVVVHPGAGNPRGTLVNGLLNRFPELEHLPRAGIVHRLDKDTSGLLLVARTVQAQHALGKLLARREISRRYQAVVEGTLTGGLDIDRPIGRDPVRRTRQAVRADGRPSLTRVRVLARYRAHTLVEATLETGRTHQIRVHLASIGHPLVGDARYGARGRLPTRADEETVAVLRGFRRQALHAWKLRLDHPDTGRELRFTAPPPADFAALVAALEADAEGHDG